MEQETSPLEDSTTKVQVGSFTLTSLPTELMVHIFGFLDGVELLQLTTVCSDWKILLEDPIVWRDLFLRTFKIKFSSLPSSTSARRDWKSVYIKKLREDYSRSKELSKKFNGVFKNTLTFSGSYGEPIFALHLNEDTSMLVAGCGNRIKMWDMSSGVLLRSIKAHNKPIRAIICDDSKIISGSLDSTVKVIDMETDMVLNTFEGHSSWVLALSYNIIHVVSGSSDKSIKLWNVADGACLNTYLEHTQAVRSVHCNSSNILSASVDKLVKLWDYNTNSSVTSFEGHTDAVVCCQFVDENIFWTGSFDHSLMKWDKRIPVAVTTHKLSVPVTCLHADPDKVVFGLWNGAIQVYDGVANRVINTLSTAYGKHKEAVNCIQFSPSKVVSGSYDCSIKVWEQENPKTITLEHLKKLLEPTPSPTKPQNNAAIPLNLPPLPLKKEKAKRMRWRPLGKKRGKKGK